MSAATIRFSIGLSTWASALLGSLLVSQIPGDWGHSICGPWGCGPPTQSLVACHLSWFVVLVPAIVLVAKFGGLTSNAWWWIGLGFFAAGLLGLVAIVVHEQITWLPSAGDYQRAYFWHRCGFVLATTVDAPITQSTFVGLGTMVVSQCIQARGAQRI